MPLTKQGEQYKFSHYVIIVINLLFLSLLRRNILHESSLLNKYF
jgi:hypothetical protein